jgi:hypothetical protein
MKMRILRSVNGTVFRIMRILRSVNGTVFRLMRILRSDNRPVFWKYEDIHFSYF